MVVEKMVRTKWYTDKMSLDKMVYGQNVIGQNGMDKMVYGQNVIGQNGTNKTVPIKSSIKYQSRSHCQYDFFINPASTLIPLHFLCVLITICDFWLLNKY